jgi:hypothetical protein
VLQLPYSAPRESLNEAEDEWVPSNSKHMDSDPLVAARTGLLLDPHFSASKIAWLLEHVPGARAKAERGELAFGTVDSFLLWRLAAGAGLALRRFFIRGHQSEIVFGVLVVVLRPDNIPRPGFLLG